MTPQLKEKESLIAQIEQKDVLLSYPFENIKSFTNLLYEAARDDSVVSIKMTLYRLAVRSQIVDALVEAAENGKEVVYWLNSVQDLMKKVTLNIPESWKKQAVVSFTD